MRSDAYYRPSPEVSDINGRKTPTIHTVRDISLDRTEQASVHCV